MTIIVVTKSDNGVHWLGEESDFSILIPHKLSRSDVLSFFNITDTYSFLSCLSFSVVSFSSDFPCSGRGGSIHSFLRRLQPAGVPLRPRRRMHGWLSTLKGPTVTYFSLQLHPHKNTCIHTSLHTRKMLLDIGIVSYCSFCTSGLLTSSLGFSGLSALAFLLQ